MKALEKADIENVFFGGHDAATTQVRGYQNYDISDDKIIAINNPSKKRPWTDTKVKSEFWEKIFNNLQPKSYADFGCNLGYYVFASALADVPSTGIDYNPEYIHVCSAIKDRHDMQYAEFIETTLASWQLSSRKYDLLTVFNVIHHLYNRTEKYLEMEPLITDFANKTSKAILFEVPTEKDKKGHKWTMDTGYSEQLFVETIERIFSKHVRIEGQTKDRPYYLCTM